MLKSTQTNKYETCCFVQEAATSSEMSKNGYKVHKSVDGHAFVTFESTLWTFDGLNRMRRRYDLENARQVIETDERIQTLKKNNKWRGELNHPNSEYEGKQYSSIRMTIPEPMRTSHFISKDRFEGSRYKALITTAPGNECGREATSEVVDIGICPSFSVRLLGKMIPNAPCNGANMLVNKVITFDWVDFPSHHDANADITPQAIQEAANVVFLKDLAKYCTEQDEKLNVVCESFEISPDEILGISNGSIEIAQESARIYIPLEADMRREALNILMGKGLI